VCQCGAEYKEVDELHVCVLCVNFKEIRVKCNVLEQVGPVPVSDLILLETMEFVNNRIGLCNTVLSE
jgi:hypothetical protein